MLVKKLLRLDKSLIAEIEKIQSENHIYSFSALVRDLLWKSVLNYKIGDK